MKVYIIRGIPGCGKTRYIAKLEELAMQHSSKLEVCSADHFMIGDDGEYEFKQELITDAHKACFLKFRNICEHPQGTGFLVVDNTNVRTAEIAPYYQFAQSLDHDVEIRTLVCDPKVAYERNIHEVPASLVYRMHLTMEAETLSLPPWWKHEVVFV